MGDNQEATVPEFVVVSAKTTANERALIRALAESQGVTVSKLVRRLVVSGARAELGA